jgi:flagellar P-ring protein precursor FlgI
MFKTLVSTLVFASVWMTVAYSQTRIKDITQVKGQRDNALVGYGLVVGISGTGDSARNSSFTRQSLKAMLDRFGVSVKDEDLRMRNVAAVMVTATVGPGMSIGSKFDATISSLGDATSLKGGTLVITPLLGADGVTYAVAQGQIIVPGFDSRGQNEAVTQGTATAGRVDNGAIIEREVPRLNLTSLIELELNNSDPRTLVSIVDSINTFAMSKYGMSIAKERSYRSLQVLKPTALSMPRLLAEIGELKVAVDVPARVVIDPRSGTVVLNSNVRISTVAVTHGNLTVRVTETPVVSQPNALSGGRTEVTSITNVDPRESGGSLGIVNGQDLMTLVNGLNRMGVKPSGVMAILQAIKSAGALHADLIIQ